MTTRLTSKLLHDAGTRGGEGWNRQQLELLGVQWPPSNGWLKGLIGKEVPVGDWNKVMALKGTKRGEREAIINSYKTTPEPPRLISAESDFAAELKAIRVELCQIRGVLERMNGEEKTCLD